MTVYYVATMVWYLFPLESIYKFSNSAKSFQRYKFFLTLAVLGFLSKRSSQLWAPIDLDTITLSRLHLYRYPIGIACLKEELRVSSAVKS